MSVPVSAPGRPPVPRRADDDVVYGMSRPDPAMARQALLDAFADDPGLVGPLWSRLLSTAGVSGSETDVASMDRLVTAFTAHEDPVVVLVGRALRIRLSTFTHLLTARRSIPEDLA